MKVNTNHSSTSDNYSEVENKNTKTNIIKNINGKQLLTYAFIAIIGYFLVMNIFFGVSQKLLKFVPGEVGAIKVSIANLEKELQETTNKKILADKVLDCFLALEKNTTKSVQEAEDTCKKMYKIYVDTYEVKK